MSALWNKNWRRPLSASVTMDRQHDPVNSVTNRSAKAALSSLFDDFQLSDVKLQGSDGKTVLAVKAILAARSPVFRERFFGDPELRKKSRSMRKEVVIFQEWDSRTLHAVVEYCYTDNLSVMQLTPNDDVARLMANLRAASKVFKLLSLLDKVNQWSWRQVTRYPSLVCALIDEGMKLDEIDEIALQNLQLKSRAALLPDSNAVGTGILALTKTSLLFVLRTLTDTANHMILLQSIQRWVEFSNEDSVFPTQNSGEHSNYLREKKSRESFARMCAMRFVDLSKISPRKLEEIMKNSCLLQESTDGDEASQEAGLRYQ